MIGRIFRSLCVVAPLLLTVLSYAVGPLVLSEDVYKINSSPHFLQAANQLLVIWTKRQNAWEKRSQLSCIRVTDNKTVTNIDVESLIPTGQRIYCWLTDDVNSCGKLMYSSGEPVQLAMGGQNGIDYSISTWQYNNAKKRLLVSTGEMFSTGNTGDNSNGNEIETHQPFYRPMLMIQGKSYFCVATSSNSSVLRFSIFDRKLVNSTDWNLTGCNGTFPSIVTLRQNYLLLLYTEASVSDAYRYNWYDEVGLTVPDQDNWPLCGKIISICSDDSGSTWSKPVPLYQIPNALQAKGVIDQEGRVWVVIVANDNKVEQTTKLLLTMSKDKGMHWETPSRIDVGEGLKRDADIAIQDGKLYVVYSCRSNGRCDIHMLDMGETPSVVKLFNPEK